MALGKPTELPTKARKLLFLTQTQPLFANRVPNHPLVAHLPAPSVSSAQLLSLVGHAKDVTAMLLLPPGVYEAIPAGSSTAAPASAKCERLLTASLDGTLRLWDISADLMSLEVRTIGARVDAIFHVVFSKARPERFSRGTGRQNEICQHRGGTAAAVLVMLSVGPYTPTPNSRVPPPRLVSRSLSRGRQSGAFGSSASVCLCTTSSLEDKTAAGREYPAYCTAVCVGSSFQRRWRWRCR